jgi:exodeoxyribonuclease V alpha subunit
MQTSQSAVGTVSKIVYASNRKQIIRLITKNDSVKVMLSNAEMHVETNDHIRVTGNVVFSEKFGKQLHAIQVQHTPVTHNLIADFLTAGAGVGKSISGRILSQYPNNLLPILESYDIDALSAVKGVSKAIATVICNNWRKQSGKVELINFMDTVLINAKQSEREKLQSAARQAFSHYQDKTVAKLKEDPYRIWSFSSFKLAEHLASAMKIPKDDQRRLVCAFEEVLFMHLDSASTQVSYPNFSKDLEELLGDSNLVLPALTAAIESSKCDVPRIIITEPKNANKMSESERLDKTKFALPGTAIMENYVAAQLKLRLSENHLIIATSNRALDDYTLPSGHNLSDSQKDAVKLILNNSVTVISGGAGTGKTSVLYCANDLIKQSGNDILQVALSGKASQRLMQQTKEHAFTIASLLKHVREDPKFLDHYKTPVVNVDEASMVDLQSMYKVLTIFEDRQLRLVFIGDWAQLAPVGVGLIFHKLMKSDKVPKIELTENFRSSTGIKQVAESIKIGELFSSNNHVELIEYEKAEQLPELIERQYYLNTYNDDDTHIIAATLRTVSKSNLAVHTMLARGRKVVAIAPQFRVGDKVLYKKNDINLDLVNGSTGVIVGQTSKALRVKFSLEGIRDLYLEDIQDDILGEYILHHAYALTCHSAQGSEFNTAIVVVEDFALVERSWLYTAITRAKKKVIILAQKEAIASVLNRGFRFEKINVGFEI